VLCAFFLFVSFCSSCSGSSIFDIVRQNHPAFQNQVRVVNDPAPNADDDDDDCLMTQDYIQKGGTCDGDLMSNNGDNDCSILKGNPSCCAYGLYCVNSACAVDNVGGPCKHADDCMPDVVPFIAGATQWPMSCNGGVCQYVNGPGDSCTVNADCANSLACTAGKCTGLTTGVLCNSSSQCAFGFYCSVTCQPAGTLNATCFGDSMCAPGFFCSNLKCVPTFSTSVGESCDKGTQFECKVGYTCVSGTCVPSTPSVIHCEHSNECTSASGNGGSCLCQPSSGKSFCSGSQYNYDSCTKARSDYYGCMSSSQCTTISNQPTSCSYSSCKSQFDKLTKCTCSTLKSQAGDLYYCNAGFATWKLIVTIVVPVVGIILLVIIVIVLVLSCRKHKDYEQI